jgi:hypothetical protein
MVYRGTLFLTSALCVLVSCGSRTTTLLNGITVAPKDKSIFRNAGKFDSSLYGIIDTAVAYEEYRDVYRYDDIYHQYRHKYSALARLDTSGASDNFYSIVRFYPNGRLNYFVINRNKPFTARAVDPRYNGYQGIYYSEGEKLKIDLFTRTSGMGSYAIEKQTFRTRADTLYMKQRGSVYERTYVKRPLPDSFFVFKPYW